MKWSVCVVIVLILFTGTLLVGCGQTDSDQVPSPEPTLSGDTLTTEPGQPSTTSKEESQSAYPPPPTEPPSLDTYPAPPTESQLEAYPLPPTRPPLEAYPVQEPEAGYPPPADQSFVTESGPPFYIDEPVLAGSTQLTGRGPAGVPIIAIDVTTVGTVLGRGIIDDDGTFVIQLDVALEEGHSVGLQIGDLSGTPFQAADFLFGDTYSDRPYIGVVLTMAPVRAE